MDSDTPWWIRNYESLDYAVSYADRTPEITSREVAFIINTTELSAGSRVLDICCAHGRHVGEFARRGFWVVGLDRSETLIKAGVSSQRATDASWVVADARSLPISRRIDLAVNLFSSFGFFDSDRDNLHMLQSCANAITDDGWLVIELFLREQTLANMRPRDWREDAGHIILREEMYDTDRSRIQRRTINYSISTGHRSERASSMRLYSRQEVDAMLTTCGLHIHAAFGGYRGEPISATTGRYLVFARRKKPV